MARPSIVDLPARPERRSRILRAGLLIAGLLSLGMQAHGVVHADSAAITAQQTFFVAQANLPFSQSIVTFSDSNAADTASSFQVSSINWGDSTQSAGTVTAVNGGFSIQGNHLYHNPGRFPVTISLTDVGVASTLNATAIVSACTVSGSPVSPYAQAVLADQPIGYWRLDDPDTDGCVADSSGNGLNGMANGGVAINQPGAIAPTGGSDPSVAFDGSTGYISLNDPAALQPAQLSVEAWIKTTHPGGIIVRKRYYGYGLRLNGDGTPIFGIDDSNAVGYSVTGPTSVADGRWHYLVGTYSGSQVCLYVDGQQAGCAAAAPIFYQPDLVAIGRDGGYAGNYFNGQIDDVAIYGAPLSPAQVSAHYAAAIIIKTATSTILTTSATAIGIGQPFTLTAAVQGSGALSGTVTFCAQETSDPTAQTAYCLAGIAPTTSGGSTFTLALGPSGNGATYSVTSASSGSPSSTSKPAAINLPAGTYSWTTTYAGDAGHLGSSSAPVSLVISQVPTTITIELPKQGIGPSVPLSALVRFTGSDTWTPTGSVIFIADGNLVLGGAQVNGGGEATITTNKLTPGAHSISAIYSGDDIFDGGIAPAVTWTLGA